MKPLRMLSLAVGFALLVNGRACAWIQESVLEDDQTAGRDFRSPGLRRLAATAPADGTLSVPATMPTATSDGNGLAGLAKLLHLQATINAAQPGQLIPIGPGTLTGTLVIDRAVVLQGAGADHTRLEVRENAPAILVQGGDDVLIRGLTVAYAGPYTKRGPLGSRALIQVHAGRTSLEQCHVLGAPGNGVLIGSGASGVVRDCLVAAAWGTGIAVSGEAQATVERCEVRNCYHRCITVGPQAGVAVRECYIAGSAWHGIRYDRAAPVIIGNILANHARFGIYANKGLGARIEDNVFADNGMSGISTWFECRPMIRGNLFSGNRRAGLEISLQSRPTVVGNTFFQNACGVRLFRAQGQEGSADEAAASISMNGNVFTANETDTSDIQLGASDQRSATLPVSWQERLAKAHPRAALTAEEQRIIPPGETRSREKWQTPDVPEEAGRDEMVSRGTTSQPIAAFWPTDRIVENWIALFARMDANQYGLTDAQTSRWERMSLQRWKPYFFEIRMAWLLVRQFSEARFGPRRPDIELVTRWAKHARPVFNVMRDQVSAAQGRFGAMLTPEQKVRFEDNWGELNGFIEAIGEALERWEQGELREREWWEPDPERRERDRALWMRSIREFELAGMYPPPRRPGKETTTGPAGAGPGTQPAREDEGPSADTAPAQHVVPSKELVEGILQRKDQELREKNLEKLRGMLSPQASDAEKRSALSALGSSLAAKFDRGPFRPLVLTLLRSQEPETRMLALSCLPGLDATPADLVAVIPMVEDPYSEVRAKVARVLIAIGKGQHEEQVVPALMKLLQDKDPEVVGQTLRSMWGQYSSPQFDHLLIKLSRQPQYHGAAIYFGLSTMRHKSAAVCRRLVEELDDPDWNNSGRAAWGLTYGVTEEARSLVEEGLLRALPEETNEYTRSQEFRALRGVATEKSRPYLKSVLDSEMETEKFKKLAREILEDLDGKR